MSLTYNGGRSPLDKPVTSVEDVTKITRDSVANAVHEADAFIDACEHEMAELAARRDRVKAHRANLAAWLAEEV